MYTVRPGIGSKVCRIQVLSMPYVQYFTHKKLDRNLNVAGLDEFVGKLGGRRSHDSGVEKCDVSDLNKNRTR
jgi:hypothetical protein